MEILSTIISILGAIIIASITYLFAKRKEREAEWRKEKLRFYITFVESLSGITECEQNSENDMRFAKACNDLYLFAPSSVLDALREFQDEVRISNPNKSLQKYTTVLSKLILEIRKDIKVKDNNIGEFIVLLWTSGHKKDSLEKIRK